MSGESIRHHAESIGARPVKKLASESNPTDQPEDTIVIIDLVTLVHAPPMSEGNGSRGMHRPAGRSLPHDTLVDVQREG